VARDYAQAIEHYAAAAAGEPHGLAELGRRHVHGIGVPIDPGRGEQMLRRGGECGWQPALGELKRVYYSRS